MRDATLILIGMVFCTILFFAIEGCVVLPGLYREWKKARRK